MTITCGSDIYKVHKAIVCSQSDFFRIACRPPNDDSNGSFKEAKTGIIELPCRDMTTGHEDPIWNADAEHPKAVKLMIHYLYHLDYLEVETAKLKSKNRYEEEFDKTHILHDGVLIDHAMMYAMGDKYGISGLKSLALAKYKEAYKFTSAGLADSITIAYTNTVDNDMALRKSVLDILDGDLTNLMGKPAIHENIKELPGLALTLLLKRLNLSI